MLLFVLEQELWELEAKWKPVSQDKRVNAKKFCISFSVSIVYRLHDYVVFEVKSWIAVRGKIH